MLKNGKEILMSEKVDPEYKFDLIKSITELKSFFDHGRKVAAFIGPSIVGMSDEKKKFAISMTEEKIGSFNPGRNGWGIAPHPWCLIFYLNIYHNYEK